MVTNKNIKVFWGVIIIKHYCGNHLGTWTNKKFILNAGTFSWHLKMYEVLKLILILNAYQFIEYHLSKSENSSFHCLLFLNTAILPLVLFCVMFLCSYDSLSCLSLPFHPLKICIKQFSLYFLVGSCLHEKNQKSDALLYLRWPQGIGRTTFVDRNICYWNSKYNYFDLLHIQDGIHIL